MRGVKQKGRAKRGPFVFLNYPCFFQRCVCAVFIDSFYRSSRDGEANRFLEFRNVNLFCLKVYISACFSDRVELGRTGRVRITAADY